MINEVKISCNHELLMNRQFRREQQHRLNANIMCLQAQISMNITKLFNLETSVSIWEKKIFCNCVMYSEGKQHINLQRNTS